MRDVLECKDAIVNLAGKGYKAAQLLRSKWGDFKEIISILQIPYKATIALQKHDLTQSDGFGIWLQMKAHLLSPSMQQFSKTNIAKCLIDALDQRKKDIFNNSAMLAAIYLDPRYRTEILNNENLVQIAKRMLLNVWLRLVSFREDLSNEITNLSNQSSGVNLSIEFNNPKLLDNYLAHKDHAPNIQDNANDHGGIELEIELFDPEKISSDCNIISYWNSMKEQNKNLFEIAMVIFAIPPAETQIERDFSLLEFVFSQRRQGLRSEMIESILTINLNAEIFYDIKKEEIFQEQ